MPGSVDRPPDLVAELRDIKARLNELNQATPRLPVIVVLEDGTASLPDSSGASVTFATVVVDTAGAFDPGTPDTVTVPRSGVYLVSGAGRIDASGAATGLRQLTLEVSTSPPTVVGFSLPPLSNNPWIVAPATMVALEAGDTIEMTAFQSSGTTLDLDQGRLAVAWLGTA